MKVELNDVAISEAKNGDVFVIEEKKGKKYAKPIPKKELLKPQNESIAELQRQVNALKDQIGEQNEKILEQNVKIDAYTKAIYKFINILKGENINEEV